jgi:Glycosyl hydrolase catalytic core
LFSYASFQDLRSSKAENPLALSTIFLDTTAPTFKVSTAGVSGDLSYTVTDFSGATIVRSQQAVTSGQTSITLSPLPDDYYVLHITDQAAGSSNDQTIPFAVVSPFTPQVDSPFGIGVHFMAGDTGGLPQLIATMGAGMLRDDATWAKIERSAGSYSFNSFDPSMRAVQQSGIDPLLILDYNNHFYDNGKTPFDDAGLSAFANYAKALVIHYGNQLKAVEVYNEYNGFFSTGPCARKPECYARMLRYTYQAIKSVRPDVTVVGGAAFYADLRWFEGLFQNGGLSYMDVVSDHPYTLLGFISPELHGIEGQMVKLQNLIKRYNHGQPKPIWITEVGWSSSFLRVSEHTQANYLVRSAILSMAAGVQKFFWYDFVNDGTNSFKMEQNFGLLRSPDAAGRYTPKPAYVAYAVLIRQLASRSFVRRESVFPGIFDMLYSDNLHVLWSTPFGQSVDLSTNNPVTAISMTGRTQTLQPSAGRIILHLSAEPLYILGNIAGVTWHNPL